MFFRIIAQRLMIIINSTSKRILNLPYWVEISTQQPECVYYFGPFNNSREARQMQGGYIEDLMEERATGIDVEIKRCMPTQLTIAKEEELFQ